MEVHKEVSKVKEGVRNKLKVRKVKKKSKPKNDNKTCKETGFSKIGCCTKEMKTQSDPKQDQQKTWGARLTIMEVREEVSKAKEGVRNKLKVRKVKKKKASPKMTIKHAERVE